MKEIGDILQSFARARTEGKKAALATVVHVEGSSYRRPGARMLVTDDGQLTGAISGGCLEGDALQKALLAIHQQQNKLVTYDTTHDDDMEFGIQLGCNGIVHILFEPIHIDEPCNPIQLLEEAVRERKNTVLVTLFSLLRDQQQPGTSLLYADGNIQSRLAESLRQQVLADVQSAFRDKVSSFTVYDANAQNLHGFIEFLSPAPALVIAGAGNDVLPLVELTSLLGWHTTIVDGRPHYATPKRFPKADRVLVAKPQEVLPQLSPDAQTTFVLMTHNYQYDLALLRELIRATTPYPYIGLLGPRKKLDRMLDELRQDGIHPDDHQLAALHGPVGLNIGAETAAEIAISIVAEIKAMLSGRDGGPLKANPASIHNRPGIISNHG
ncbi:XdhC/CoxI family protein [Puia sp.]|jgi:xanthine/CO dehydrogenase XdhC/CoxF family maturation factor|uniref:XdhC family protein n=1 Tax=Puia sp. TaxID=2045100 RepID=UPI002F41DEFB